MFLKMGLGGLFGMRYVALSAIFWVLSANFGSLSAKNALLSAKNALLSAKMAFLSAKMALLSAKRAKRPETNTSPAPSFKKPNPLQPVPPLWKNDGEFPDKPKLRLFLDIEHFLILLFPGDSIKSRLLPVPRVFLHFR